MNRILFACLFFLSIVGYSQQLNTLPNIDLSRVSDGWHKFIVHDVVFDVEIKEEKLVKGVIQWLDGSSYSGELYNNSISGKGTYKWPNGIRYEGNFKRSKRHGRGSLILQNGTKWSGKWKDNRKNGKGKIYDVAGRVIKKGVWKDDILLDKTSKKQ